MRNGVTVNWEWKRRKYDKWEKGEWEQTGVVHNGVGGDCWTAMVSGEGRNDRVLFCFVLFESTKDFSLCWQFRYSKERRPRKGSKNVNSMTDV